MITETLSEVLNLVKVGVITEFDLGRLFKDVAAGEDESSD